MARDNLPDDVPCEDPSDLHHLTVVATEDEDDYDDGTEFHVVRILAEEGERGDKRFLVFWKDYTIKWATWEPRESFSDASILNDWSKRKASEVRGEVKPFDISGWKAAAVKRRRLRKIKRKRAGLPVSSDEDSSSDEAEENQSIPIPAPKTREYRAGNTKLSFNTRQASASSPDPPLARGPRDGATIASLTRTRRLQRRPEASTTKDSSEDDTPLLHLRQHGQLDVPARPVGTQQSASSNQQRIFKSEENRTTWKANAPQQNVIEHAPESTLTGTFSTRGRIATRGGSSLPGKHVFDDSFANPKRRVSLRHNASDPQSNKKLFNNARHQRKTELMGRNVADRAPNVSALGGLFDPANPPTKQPLLQKKPLLAEAQQKSQKTATTATDTLLHDKQLIEQNSLPRSQVSNLTPPGKLPFLCYYWSTKSICKREPSCPYIHEAVDLPVARMPHNVVSTRRQPCLYYFQRGGCTFAAEDCQYSHELSNAEITTSTSNCQLPYDNQAEINLRNELPSIQSTNEVLALHQTPTNVQTSIGAQYRCRDGSYRDKFPDTCRYWEAGNCRETSATCRFYHKHPPFDVIPLNKVVSHDSRISTIVPPVDNPAKQSTQRPLILSDTATTPDAEQLMQKPLVHHTELISELSLFVPERQEKVLEEDGGGTFPHAPHFDNAESNEISRSNCPNNVNDEDQRKQTANYLPPNTKEVLFGPMSGESVVLDFGDLGDELWTKSFSTLKAMRFDRVCAAQDFCVQFSEVVTRIFKHGCVKTERLNPSDQRLIETLYESLRFEDAGLFFSGSEICVLLYPTRTQSWAFLESMDGSAPNAAAWLRYIIFESQLDLSQRYKPRQKSLEEKSPTYWALLTTRLGWNSLTPLCKPGDKLPRHFYLMFPSAADLTASFVKSYIEHNAPGSFVYHAGKEGSWDAFVNANNRGRILVVHESVVSCIADLPGLMGTLRKGELSVWCISGDSGSAHGLYPSMSASLHVDAPKITCTSLFPHGGAMLLTPSLIIAEPKLAYDSLKWFLSKERGSTPGTWKFVCAYDLQSYLLDVAIEKSMQRDAFYVKHAQELSKDADAAALRLSYEDCETRFRFHLKFVELLQNQDLVGYPFDYDLHNLDEDLSPIIYAPPSIDPDDEQGLVAWFAGWAILKADLYRKFVVVGTGLQDGNRAVRFKSLKKPKVRIPKDPLTGRPTAGVASQTRPGIENPYVDTGKPSTYPVFTPGSGLSLKTRSVLGRQDQSDRNKPAVNPDNPMTMIATRDLDSRGIRLAARLGDHISLSKYVSGDLYYSINVRTGEKGQVSLSDMRPLKSSSVANFESIKNFKDDTGEAMDIDTENDSMQGYSPKYNDTAVDPLNTENGMAIDPDVPNEIQYEEVIEKKQLEVTMRWYRNLLDGGGGWQHLFVEEWANARAFLEGRLKK